MKKIMFNDRYGLTEAVLSGRKTQARQIIPQPFNEKIIAFKHQYFEATFNQLTGIDLLNQYFFIEKIGKLPYQVGEIVAVAQSYKDIACGVLFDDLKEAYRTDPTKLAGWSNKMFVRADLMPHRILITNVRVERLQNISDEDCEKEGIYKDESTAYFNGYAFEISKDQHGNILANKWYKTPREAYAALIDRIAGKGTWEHNPWVFVYDF